MLLRKAHTSRAPIENASVSGSREPSCWMAYVPSLVRDRKIRTRCARSDRTARPASAQASPRLRQDAGDDARERGTSAAWSNEMAHTLRIFLVVLSTPMVIAIAACGADDTAARSTTGSAGATSVGPTTSTATTGASS